jgi:two-component system, OmpR family, sensor histidine kinase VicK
MVIDTEPLFSQIFKISAACLLLKVDGPTFMIVAVSDKYLAMTATTREQLIGKDAFDIFPDKEGQQDGAITTRKAILEVFHTGRQVVIPDYLYHIYVPGKGRMEPFWWTSTFDPVFEEDGSVGYVLGTAVDNTDQHISRRTLNEAEEMLHLAVEAAHLGTWSIDVTSKEIMSSGRSKQLYGLKENEHATFESILNAVHEDYRDKVATTLAEAMQSDGTQSYIIDYPLQGIKDQHQRWVRSTAKLFLNVGDSGRMLCGTLVDITENKIVERKKNDFITMVSHEMKTPLTSIIAYLELLLKKSKAYNDDFMSNSISRARSQTNKLKNMIISFLDLAGVEDGNLVLNKSDFEINELISEMVADMLPYAVSHTIRFDGGKKLMVNADEAKIGQVVTNFLSNSIKYADTGTEILIQYETDHKSIKVMISDHGPGIKPEHQKKLFDRFYRVNRDVKTKSGFGIGLYLAAEIIKHHQGSIGVTSEEGKGSTFYFILPIRK